MGQPSSGSAPETWQHYARQIGEMDLAQLEYAPNFLVIAPAKTGTTWLSQNLSCHPDIYIPPVKEVKFFSTYWRWLGINWYLDQFCSASHPIRGEATPSYALLPSHRIKFIKSLLPNIKLVFLMRDPVERAWSHAKHSYRYREANFRHPEAPAAANLDQQFIANFTRPWPCLFGDYLGALQRWLTCFSKEQLYIGFFEAIKDDPQKVLTEVFKHLGAADTVDWSHFRLHEKILPGIEQEIKPEFKAYLRSLYQERTQKLADFLKAEFHITLPSQWTNTVEEKSASDPSVPADSFWGPDDQFLVNILREEVFVSGPRLVEKNYRGFNLVIYLGEVYALAQTLGPLDLVQIGASTLKDYHARGQCFVGATLDEVKQAIAQQVGGVPFG